MTTFLQFDFSEIGACSPPLRFANPIEIVSARDVGEVLSVLRRVQCAVDQGMYAAGFVAYEAAPAFDAALAVPPQSDLPLAWFGLFDQPLPVAHKLEPESDYRVGAWECAVDEERYRSEVGAIRESIAAGDFYQVNDTVRLRAEFDGDAYAWYRQLRLAQGAGLAAYLDIGRFQIVSISPELFFRADPCSPSNVESDPRPLATARRGVSPARPTAPSRGQARTLLTRPMKGTHRRGRWPDEDHSFRNALRDSEKDRAENLMIVDLLRNDLGRIAVTGTVNVEELFSVERYPTLYQMTSSISAGIDADTGLPEILSALFPCGSVTGAPKIAAMQRIAAMEPEPRQVYCGTIGYLAPDNTAIFNVAIRTVIIDRAAGTAEYGVGSGITWDSRPEAEYAENRLKAEVLTAGAARPDLFETLRLQEGVYSRTSRHLERITASADYFDIPVQPSELLKVLNLQAHEQPVGLWRVRLRLSAQGAIRTECEPLDVLAAGARAFDISTSPVDRRDRLLFHKIADRARYKARKVERPDIYDVLMQNRDGELTEFTTGNVVLEIDGRRVTPSLDCGLLPGVFRAELLDAGTITQAVLGTRELERASQVWLINSLRGWVPMSWRPDLAE